MAILPLRCLDSLLAAAVASLRRVAATRRRSFNCKQAEKVSLSKKRRRGKEVNVRETTRQPCCFNEVLIINLFDCLEHQLLSKTSRPLSTALWSMVVLPLNRCSWKVLCFLQVWVNGWGLDLSEDLLWVSVCQRTAQLQAVKVGDLKKIQPRGPPRTTRVQPGFDSRTIRSSSNFDSL